MQTKMQANMQKITQTPAQSLNQSRTNKIRAALALMIALFGVASIGISMPALADKPSWAGGEKRNDDRDEKQEKRWKKENEREYKNEYKRDKKEYKRAEKEDKEARKYEKYRERGQYRQTGSYFTDQQRFYAHEYYVEEYRTRRCPPGLAKKNNGCYPPGIAKRWIIGEPIPREVVYYEVPPQVSIRIGPPPTGHRYVRVASDILLVAIGTGIVLDALNDLHR